MDRNYRLGSSAAGLRRLLCVIAIASTQFASHAAAATSASTLAQLCPGTPDPCVVSGQFTIPDDTTFDLAGKAFQLASGASMLGDGSASFAIVGASSIALAEGSLLSTSPTGVAPGLAIPCPPTDGLSHPSSALSRFNGESANGTWTLAIIDQFAGDIGTLNAWGLQVCTSGGCTLFPSTDVPKTIVDLSTTTSTVAVSTVGTITQLSIIDLRGTHTFMSDLEFHLISPSATDATIINNICGSDNDFDLDLQGGLGVSGADIALQATGACSLDGKVIVDALSSSGAGGVLVATCDGISLGAASLIRAKGSAGPGGSVILDAGPGSLSSVARAKIDARGSGDVGGALEISAGSTCTLEGTSIRLSAGTNRLLGGGPGGSATLTCNGINLNGSTKIEANGAYVIDTLPPAGGIVVLDAGTGAVSTATRTKILAKGKADIGGEVDISAAMACTLGGQIDASAKAVLFTFDGDTTVIGGDGGTIDISCGSVSMPAKAKITVGKGKRSYAGLMAVTAATTVQIDKGASIRSDGAGDPNMLVLTAGDACTINGKVTAKAKFASPGGLNFVCEGFSLGAGAVLKTSSTADRGGGISVDTTGDDTGEPPAACTIDGLFKAHGSSASLFGGVLPGTGGDVLLLCGTTLTLGPTGVIEASGSGAESGGGTISLFSIGDTLLGGRVLASGKDEGGGVDVDACGLTLASTGQIHSDGAFGGFNNLTAHDALTIDGSVSAVVGGLNSFTYLNAFADNNPTHTAPTATVMNTTSPCM